MVLLLLLAKFTYISGKKLVSWKKLNNDRQDSESQAPRMAKLSLIMKEYPKLDLKCVHFQLTSAIANKITD